MKDAAVYLDDIIESVALIRDYVHGMTFRDFDSDNAVQDAVARRLEIIGEAVKRLPAPLRQKQPDIPWKQVAGMRDILIHEYAGVSPKTIWMTVSKDLGALEKAAKKLKG